MDFKNMPWILVVIALIAFWPVGLFLLYKKLSGDRRAAMTSGKTISFISLILLGLGLLLLLTGFRGMRQMLFPAFLMLFGGYWLGRAARKVRKTGERNKQYIALVANQNITSIDHIASILNIPQDKVIADLQEMIRSGYFRDAYINMNSREIAFPHSDGGEELFTKIMENSGKPRVVVCQGCGANNLVSGSYGECEYCGTPLADK